MVMGVKLVWCLRVLHGSVCDPSIPPQNFRRKCWTRRGPKQKVSGKRSRGRVNVMGGLRYHDRKRLCFFVDKGNADSFFEQLIKLNEFVKQECLGKAILLSFMTI